MLNKITILLSFLFFISACDVTKNNILAPNKKIWKQLPKDLHPDTQKGWLDGCESGLSTGFATDYYRTFYKFQKDINMVKEGNRKYLRTWSWTYIYCRHYALGTLTEADMRPQLVNTPGKSRILPLSKEAGGHSLLGNVFSLNGLGSQGLANW